MEYRNLTPERATRLCAAALTERGLELDRVGEMSVAVVSSERIRRLNHEFRDKDRPTDVLSFEVDGPYGEMVGEIVVCPDAAEMDVGELVVHGALHLAGMDHGDDFGDSEMSRVQETVMEKLRGPEG